MILHNAKERFHQIASVRKRENVSLELLSKRLGMPKEDVRALEKEHRDLPLSLLYRFATALQVPVSELFLEAAETSSSWAHNRALLVRVMKTAEALRAVAVGTQLNALTRVLRSQLLELMPELEEIKPWPKGGTPGPRLGRVAIQTFPDLPECDQV